MTPLRILLVLILCSAGLAAAPSASAEWIWSPQTGWIGPTGAVKDTPEEQFAVAMEFFNKADYKRARIEFRKLLRAYKASPEAAEAQYFLGRVEEEDRDYYKAFLEYRKTLQVYPSTKRFEEILEREYRIGNLFLEGHKRKVFGMAALLPARDKAVEIFEAIATDGPFSDYGQLAQYKLGLAHLTLQTYEQAVNAFEEVVSRYPESPLVDDARYQIAVASLKGTFRPAYDQSPTNRAIQELQAFTRGYPTSDLVEEATTRIGELHEQRAEHDFLVAQYYEDRRLPAAALIYYRTIVDRDPQTSWAVRAAGRIDALEARHAPPTPVP